LQARGDALLQLPKGKSAMVLYAATETGETLSGLVRGRGAALLTRAARLGARWVRFAAAPRAAREATRLLRQFEERFGAPPPANVVEDLR
jgi:hypothetical protein